MTVYRLEAIREEVLNPNDKTITAIGLMGIAEAVTELKAVIDNQLCHQATYQGQRQNSERRSRCNRGSKRSRW